MENLSFAFHILQLLGSSDAKESIKFLGGWASGLGLGRSLYLTRVRLGGLLGCKCTGGVVNWLKAAASCDTLAPTPLLGAKQGIISRWFASLTGSRLGGDG